MGASSEMAMGRWFLKGSRLPSQASPAGRKPVFIFKERVPIAVVSLGVLAITMAQLPQKGWGPPDTISGGAQHLPQPGFTSTAGWERSGTPSADSTWPPEPPPTVSVGWGLGWRCGKVQTPGGACSSQWVRFSPTAAQQNASGSGPVWWAECLLPCSSRRRWAGWYVVG